VNGHRPEKVGVFWVLLGAVAQSFPWLGSDGFYSHPLHEASRSAATYVVAVSLKAPGKAAGTVKWRSRELLVQQFHQKMIEFILLFLAPRR
jgi:hypothetical protein